MTLHRHGYALQPGESLEDLDMGGGSVLSLRVTGEQSNGLVTVIEGIVNDGGPLLHVHESKDEVVIVLDGELAHRVGEQRGVLAGGGLLWFPVRVPHAVANLSARACQFLMSSHRLASRAYSVRGATISGLCHPAPCLIQLRSARYLAQAAARLSARRSLMAIPQSLNIDSPSVGTQRP